MRTRREEIGGLGNLLFKEAFIYGQLLDGKIPDLYLQSSQYWTQHRDKVRQRFSFGIHDQYPQVALHIRRGDYLKASQFHVQLYDTDYYKRAVELFPTSEFMVFCKDNQDPEIDRLDREWCQGYMQSLVGERFIMAPANLSETEDMNMMASCSSLIMANSSFSWWAAFLGRHARVVCPKNWFSDGIQRTELLPYWTLL